MKRILLPVFLFSCLLSTAQKKSTNKSSSPVNQSNPSIQVAPRCANDAYLQKVSAKYPSYLNSIKQSNNLLNSEVRKRLDQRLFNKQAPLASTPVIIPVVVHIVLPDPSAVTDASVQYQIDRLNKDFSGLNADSSNLSPMYPYSLRGHSKIQFVLAKKDAGNNFTTGVERRCSSTKFNGEDNDPIKLTSQGGLSAWNPDKYLNVWVGNTDIEGALGYATYPYSVAGYNKPPQAFDGIAIKAEAFGNNTTLYPNNRGRTLVHETGHYFGLFHIFQGGCNNQDFSSAGFDTGNTDDTPAQNNATGEGNAISCPSGTVASGCTGNTLSRLYQNFMDYTDDPCMSMFTVNQVIRMETALDIFLPGLKTSMAATSPVAFNKDLQVLSTIGPNAGNPAYMPCNSVVDEISYCTIQPEYFISPTLIFRNTGNTAINELEIWYKDGTGIAKLNKKVQLNHTLAFLDTATVQLQPIGLNNGHHDLQVFTVMPDGTSDENPSNDTIHLSVLIELPENNPATEDFEGPSFPSSGWKIANQGDDSYTWQKTTAGYKSGQTSAYINFYDYDRPGSVDDLLTPAINIAFADSIILSFERAYKEFDTSVKDFSDTLEILVSEDCGASYRTAWKAGGSVLASVPGSTGLFNWVPNSSDWKQTTIDLRPFVSHSAHAMRVIFRAKNGYGQNLYLDDISVKAVIKPIRDAGILSISSPARNICNGNVTPAMVITNLGEDSLRKLTVSYSVDGGSVNTLTWFGNLAKFQQETVTFDEIALNTGSHLIKFSIHSPNDLQDEQAANDSLNWRVIVSDLVNAPVKEGFESAVFPPVNWDTSGFGQRFNWQRTTSTASLQQASAWTNNNSNTQKGSRQDLISPRIKVQPADSVIVAFDVSHVTKDYPFSPTATDTLQVLLTTDCGKSFTTVYKKWGGLLNTLRLAYPVSNIRDSVGFLPTQAAHWRRDTVNITKALGSSSEFQLVFRNTNNNDNNLYLDNIHVNEVNLPVKLKQAGYQLLPNPTTGVFLVRHYLPPLNLEGIQVVNPGGQLTTILRYKGNAPSLIPIDLTNHAPGVYSVRLKYKDKTVIEKIIKVN